MIKTGLGQDSHRVQEPSQGKPLMLGGILFKENFALEGNSDSDVILHAITNALSGVTGKPILGPIADGLCRAGTTQSDAYLKLAITDLSTMGFRLTHVSVAVECLRPKILPHLSDLRASLASLLGLTLQDVGLTATSGEGLTDFGRGFGIQALAIITTERI